MIKLFLRILLLTTFCLYVLLFDSCKDKCSGVNQNLGTENLASFDKKLLFPYSPFDTIHFLVNGVDTLTLFGGDIINQYDNSPNLYENDCQTYYKTQNLAQSFSGNGNTLKLNCGVPAGWFCCPYHWKSTISFNKNDFADNDWYDYMKTLPATDTLYINGNKYSNVYYKTHGNFSDTIYYCYNIGIIRMKMPDGIYNRIPKY